MNNQLSAKPKRKRKPFRFTLEIPAENCEAMRADGRWAKFDTALAELMKSLK